MSESKSELSRGIDHAIAIIEQERRRRGGNAKKPPPSKPNLSGGAAPAPAKVKENAD